MRYKNILHVHHKGLRINVGIDAETNHKLQQITASIIQAGNKQPSTSIMVRYALRSLAENFNRVPLERHITRIKLLA